MLRLLSGCLLLVFLAPAALAAERTEVVGFGHGDVGVRYTGDFLIAKQVELAMENVVAEYDHLVNDIGFDAEIGVAPGLEFRALIPFRADDRKTFRDAEYYGFDPVTGGPTYDSDIPVPSSLLPQTIRRGFGDIWLGITGSPISEAFDPAGFGTLSFDVDVKLPTGAKYFKVSDSGVRGFGTGAVDIRFGGGFSKRWRDVDPYIWADYTYTGKFKTDLANDAGDTVTTDAELNPSDEVQMAFGAEAIASENTATGSKFAVDFRFMGVYRSAARWEAGHYLYDTHPSSEGTVIEEDEHLRVGALIGLYVYVGKHFKMQINGRFDWDTPHQLEGSSKGAYRVLNSAETYRIGAQFLAQAHF